MYKINKYLVMGRQGEIQNFLELFISHGRELPLVKVKIWNGGNIQNLKRTHTMGRNRIQSPHSPVL